MLNRMGEDGKRIERGSIAADFDDRAVDVHEVVKEIGFRNRVRYSSAYCLPVKIVVELGRR